MALEVFFLICSTNEYGHGFMIEETQFFTIRQHLKIIGGGARSDDDERISCNNW
jgi:hypothetical protein